MVFAVASIVSQRAEQRRLQVNLTGKSKPIAQLKIDQPKLAKYWLAAVGAIMAAFLLASLLIVRFRRRLLAHIAPKDTPPTPTEDAWQMHKPPDVPPEQLYEQPDDSEPRT